MKKADLVDIQTTSGLRGMRPVLDEWLKTVSTYAKALDDPCWWYTERATLSTLAGAAWRKNWVALEEYSTKKSAIGDKEDPELHRLKSGRCDLFIHKGNTSFAIEAKQIWQPIGPRVRSPNYNIAPGIKKAWDAAGELNRKEADARLAMSFVVPSFPVRLLGSKKDDRKANATKIVNDWLPSIKADFKWDAYAHIFPDCLRLAVPENGKRVFPGVVVLIRQRKQGTRFTFAKATS